MVNENILIVDDSSFVRDLLKRELLNYGYKNIYEGANGEEGVSLYEDISPSIVIMDADMPIMNGIEALERIKRIDKSAKVLILSEKNIKKEALSKGAVGFLQKPFQPAYIWRRIDEINKFKEDKLDALEFELEGITDESRCNSDLCFEMENIINEVNDIESSKDLEVIVEKDEEINGFTKEEELIVKDNSQEGKMIIKNESLYKEKDKKKEEYEKELIIEDTKIKESKKKTNQKKNYKISISPPRGEQYLLMEESLEERKKERAKGIMSEDELILNKKTKDDKEDSENRGFLEKIKNIKKEISKTIKQKGWLINEKEYNFL